MAKMKAGQGVPLKPKNTPRLEGDELYAWAQMIAEESRVAGAKQMMAIQFLQQRGLKPGEHLLSDDGYIISAEQHRALQDRTHPSEPPSSPDSATPD